MSPIPDAEDLLRRLGAATGPDPELDAMIAENFDMPAAAYTSSSDSCFRLVAMRFADWHLHVGFGGSGIFPYASLARGDDRFDAEAPTVPIAILRVAGAARMRQH